MVMFYQWFLITEVIRAGRQQIKSPEKYFSPITKNKNKKKVIRSSGNLGGPRPVCSSSPSGP